MENASKALIIAGAILISILLISVGIIIMNAINNPIERTKNQSDSQAIEIFNSKFTGYTGKQTASAIKALMTQVSSSNGTEEDLKVEVKYKKIGGSSQITPPGTIQSQVNSQKSYVVTLFYGDESDSSVKYESSAWSGDKTPLSGYVYKIEIEEK